MDTEKRVSNWGVLSGLAFIHLGALAAFDPHMFSWPAFFVMLGLIYLTNGLGIAFCYHRLLTHRSMKVPKPLEYLTAIFGTLSLQGSPIDWVATHRIHHAYSDTGKDPHDSNRGFSWSHLHWLYLANETLPSQGDQARLAPELHASPFYQFLGRYFWLLQLGLAAVLFLAGGLPFVVWGVLVRLVLTYHLTWFVNSAAHNWGYQTYRSNDRSTNCWWLGVLGWGEGWHNNHHAFPSSARHGLAWYEFDATWLTIKLFRALRIVSDVKLPSAALRQRLRMN